MMHRYTLMTQACHTNAGTNSKKYIENKNLD